MGRLYSEDEVCYMVEVMAQAHSARIVMLLLLSAAFILARVVSLMLGPLLVDLAREFDTSVAVTGQLAAATFIAWGVVAPLVGPVSDTYGRRVVALSGILLMAVGLLGSALAWDFTSLLVFRILSGAGAAMIPPNSMAAIADHFPPAQRGKAVGLLFSSSWIGVVVGVPLVAIAAGLGGWQAPFYGVGGLSLLVWVLLWKWLPRTPRQPGASLAFLNRFREAGSKESWYVLGANMLQQTAFFGLVSYLPAYLIQTYGLSVQETALPLAVMGAGALAGSMAGGFVAGRPQRLAFTSLILVSCGVGSGVVFNLVLSQWTTVGIAVAVITFLALPLPVLMTLMMELAGRSKATATGMFSASNQLGGVGGSSLGGLVLSLGGFPLVGVLCMGAALVGAAVVRVSVRNPAEFTQQIVSQRARSTAD